MTCESTLIVLLFFFNDTATTEIYTLSLHDALPIFAAGGGPRVPARLHRHSDEAIRDPAGGPQIGRHTSELQSQSNLVCRLLLEKKKQISIRWTVNTMRDDWPCGTATEPYRASGDMP